MLDVPRGHGVQALTDTAPSPVLKVPAGHDLHRVRPLRSLKVPAGQGVQVSAPSPLKVPRGHVLHALGDTEPVSGLNVPDGHALQMEEEGRFWKEPGRQGTHCVAPCGENEPRGHGLQSEMEVALSAVEKVPGGQRLHERELGGLY
eukprot:GFKZ01004979.1.p4 GENE.GFKZ01004979.1~~GFKZ01004979.1.p4  ORF type:complete len:146 (-),score=2.65 GFKZ01004979.1:117-554(-)